MAYWYIPFIMVIFLLSPLFIRYIHTSLNVQIYWLLALSLLPIFIHRPVDNISVMQSAFYYLPFYLFGITFSLNKESIFRLVEGKNLYFLLFICILSYTQIPTGTVGNYHKPAFVFDGIDLQFSQKAAMCLFFISLLRNSFRGGAVLDVLAQYSFAIFFLHPYFLVIFGNLLNRFYSAEPNSFIFIFFQ